MVAITYVEPDGTTHSVELEEGISLMQGALAHSVRGIDGDCGGACACGTCHVHVDGAWLPHLGAPGETEAQMLAFSDGATANSRLACQVKVHAGLVGAVVRVAAAQH
jgi:ferredoxin, 2Fe-2S